MTLSNDYYFKCKNAYPTVFNVLKNDDDVFIHLHFFASIQMALTTPYFYMVRGLTKIAACELMQIMCHLKKNLHKNII